MDANLEKARAIIVEEVARAGYEVRQILFFGSRARGDARPDSDWDFYVILNAEVDRKTRHAIASRICWRLAREGMIADVILQSEQTVQQRREDLGTLTYYVLREGVAV